MSKMRFFALQELSNRKPLEVTALPTNSLIIMVAMCSTARRCRSIFPKKPIKLSTDAIEKGTPISREIADLDLPTA